MSEEEWKPYGNYIVICNGKIFVHPVRPWWWLLEAYIVVGLGVFIYEHDLYNTWVSVVGIFLGLLSLLASYKTILSDPGVFPKPLLEIALLNEQEAYDESVLTSCRRVFKDVHVKGTNMTEKHSYCILYNKCSTPVMTSNINILVWLSETNRCRNFRPPKCFHCDVCDCCINGLDHHCPVFGGCIGDNNLYWFHVMVYAIPTFWIYLLISSLHAFFNGVDKSNYTSYPSTLICVFVGFIGSIVFPPIFKLFPCIDRVHHLKPRRLKHPFGSRPRAADATKFEINNNTTGDKDEHIQPEIEINANNHSTIELELEETIPDYANNAFDALSISQEQILKQ